MFEICLISYFILGLIWSGFFIIPSLYMRYGSEAQTRYVATLTTLAWPASIYLATRSYIKLYKNDSH